MTQSLNDERLRRWRLVLGSEAAEGTGADLSQTDGAIDAALEALYGESAQTGNRKGGLGGSAPNVARWLGDIRTYFPSSVVRIMQKDALERLNLTNMLLEPELLQTVEPDVHLVATLLSLNRVMPERTRETARQVVRQVTSELEKRLRRRTEQAIRGSLNRAARTNRRPRYNEIDWNRTIRANLKHYQPQYRTIIPEQRFGYGHKQNARLRDIILCIDQSGSMATSVVYAGIFAAVLASIKSVNTQVVAFDTAVVDLTPHLQDPVDVLFATQLGGGTDIHRALTYCAGRIRRPRETILVLISDLYEGGSAKEMLKQASLIVGSGVQMVALLALSDQGAPAHDNANAQALAALGVPSFACTPDLFPELMAAAIEHRDLTAWVEGHQA